MPDWLTAEIDAGRLAAARPDLVDRLLLLVIGPMLLLAPLALVVWPTLWAK